MKTVILCGGLGTRLRDETAFRPIKHYFGFGSRCEKGWIEVKA